MRNKDTLLLEQAYDRIYNEMAYGLGAGGTQMTIQQIMDLVIHKNQTDGKRETPISFTSVTDYAKRMYKKQSNFKTMYKVSQTVASLGDYKTKLNRDLVKQGEDPVDEVGARKAVMQRLSQNIGVSTRGNPLLMFSIAHSKPSIHVAREQNGELHVIGKEEFDRLKYPSKPNERKEYHYAISSLVAVKIGGQEIINTETPEDKMEVFNFVRDQLKS